MTKYNCPSYYNDNNELVDCTCGECGLDKQLDEILDEYKICDETDAILTETGWERLSENLNEAKKELKKLIIEAKIEEFKSFNYDYATCIAERISELKKELESL